MEQVNMNIKLLGAVIVGAAVGATLGILLAPERGKGLRKKLESKGEGLKSSASEKYTDLLKQLKKDLNLSTK